MFLFDQVTSYLLVLALLTLFVAVLVWQRQRTQRTVAVWLASGLIGVLLGSAGSYGIMRLLDYQLVKIDHPMPGGFLVTTPEPPIEPGGMPSMSVGGPMDAGGPMGMGGMGMGGPPAPRPKRDLTTLVRKLDLLTGDIALSLSSEQSVSLAACLKDVEKAESMSDDDAQAKHDEILAMLDETQKARLDSIGLPRRGRGGPGGGGPGMGGPGQGEPVNPFTQEVEAKALDDLRRKLSPKEGAPADAPK